MIRRDFIRWLVYELGCLFGCCKVCFVSFGVWFASGDCFIRYLLCSLEFSLLLLFLVLAGFVWVGFVWVFCLGFGW